MGAVTSHGGATHTRTTVSTVRGRVLVAALVAVAETGIRLAGDYHVALLAPLYPAPPILALAIVGPIAKAIDLARHREAVARTPGRLELSGREAQR